MGRPRKGIITDIALRLLEEPHPDYPDKTRAQVIAEKWLKRAEVGDDFGQLLDRVEGKPVDKAGDQEIDDQPATDEAGNPLKP